MDKSVTVNLKIKGYTSRVLGVVKEKYGLKDKAAALDKFAEMFGEDFVEPELKEEYVKEMLRIEKEHFKKYGYRKTTVKELRKEIEGE